MTALNGASALCAELDRRHVPYRVAIARDDALMVLVAVPGERWEIEYFDDGRVELERFVSHGVDEAQEVGARLLAYFDDAGGAE